MTSQEPQNDFSSHDIIGKIQWDHVFQWRAKHLIHRRQSTNTGFPFLSLPMKRGKVEKAMTFIDYVIRNRPNPQVL